MSNYKMEIVEKSYCCDYDVAWVKGSYMGSGEWECCRCNRPCQTYKKEVKIFVRPKVPKNFKPYN
jgi:hypothetical protein